MKISALTACVGENYARYLEKSLPLWLDTVDELVIATDKETEISFVRTKWRALVHKRVTDVFTAHGASFNKGAALSAAFADLHEPDWVLNFDADILPPPDWRKKVESLLRPGKLFGASHRYREDGSIIPDADYPNIWGFFHLWNVADYHSWKRPVFDSTCGHAGNYDHSFMMQWEESARVDLWPNIKLIHQGEPRQQWFGRDKKNDKKMFSLFSLGLWDAWKTKAGHIKAPEPKETVIAQADNLTNAQIAQLLNAYTDPDPFKYSLEIKCPSTIADVKTS